MVQTYESGYARYLTKKLEAADTTAYVSVAPTVTKGRIFLTDGVNKEWISFTGVSGLTLTGLTRGLSKTADPSTAGTGTAWIAGTEIKLVAMHDQMVDKQEATTFADTVTVSDTSVAGVRLQSLTTAQMNAIASPANGDLIYNSTAGENYQYIGGAWSAVSAGSTQANASDTVAGKVEFNTTAQSIAATDTGETGAATVNHPSDIAKNIQSATFVYGADAGGDDTYVVALTPTLAAYTTGQSLYAKVTTSNTGACSFDFGPGVKNVKTLDGNDPQTGALRASGIVHLIYDGTNLILQTADIASITNKGILELATSPETIAESDTTRGITPSGLGASLELYGVEMIPGTATTGATANTSRTTTSTSYVKLKQFTVNYAGTYTVSFDLDVTNASGLASARIYKNGVAFGSVQTQDVSGPVTKSEDLAFAAGDTCELRVKTNNIAYIAEVTNFNMKYDYRPRFFPNVSITVDTD